MIKRTFTIREGNMKLSSLRKHQFVDAMGYLRPDELYLAGVAELGQLRKPIVTEDGFVVANQDLVDALIQIGENEADIMIIEGSKVDIIMNLTPLLSSKLTTLS